MCLSLYLSLREVEGGQEDCYGVGRYLGPRRGARDGESSAAGAAGEAPCVLAERARPRGNVAAARGMLARSVYKYTVQDAARRNPFRADFRVRYKWR